MVFGLWTAQEGFSGSLRINTTPPIYCVKKALQIKDFILLKFIHTVGECVTRVVKKNTCIFLYFCIYYE